MPQNEDREVDFLNEMKRELDITWTDDDTDKKVQECIEEGIEVLNGDVGTSIDFSSDKEAKGLLKTYVRYRWNKSEEYFIENNLERLLKLEKKYGKV